MMTMNVLVSRSRSAPAGRPAHHELRLEEQLVGGRRGPLDLVDQHVDRRLAHQLDRLPHGGQRRVGARHQHAVVEADHRDVAGHVQAEPAGGPDRAQGQHVTGADQRGDAPLDQPGGGQPGTLHREVGPFDGPLRRRAGPARDLLDPGQLAARRHVVLRAHHHADPFVPERAKVSVGLLHRHRVVRGDVREAEAVHAGVDHHHRHPPVQQLPVVPVLGVGEGVRTAGEDHPGHLVVQQHLDVVTFGHAADRAGAQGGSETALRQRRGHHLGQRREDRVLQLGQHQADQPAAFAAQLGGTLVAQHVQGREHGRAGRLGHAAAAVEHPADGRLADAGLLRHLGETFGHGGILRQDPANLVRDLAWPNETMTGLAEAVRELPPPVGRSLI